MNEKYVPLYRKYRPQKLEELVGQDHIKNALTNAIELNKISHAYLFTGPRGTGKTSTARIFAKSLNCKNGPTINPCGECESCIDIANAVPMDVIEIDAASNRKVEDTQNILEKILYAPVYGKYKIYIIDEVHMLSNTAFNSLLKTLEEPPENVIFILATTEVHKVLDTIKSRCQRFDFRRITTDDIVKHLRYISDKENINIEDDALKTIAKNSAGGMRDSIALLDQLSILAGKDPITTDDINKLLGRISFDVLHELSSSIISSSPQIAIESLEKIYNSGNEPVQILSNLLDYLKNLLIVKNCRKEVLTELTQLNEPQIAELKKQSENLETHQLVSLVEKCSDFIKELKLTTNPKLWLEVALIDMSNLTENTKLEDLQRRLSMLETGEPVHHVSAYKTPPTPVSKPNMIKPKVSETVEKAEVKPQETQTAKPQEVEKPQEAPKQSAVVEDFSPIPKAATVDKSSDIMSVWASIMENISSPPTKSLLRQWAKPVEISAENVVISINSENLLKQFVEGHKRDVLINAVNKFFGQENSNVLVRLPRPDDVKVQAVKVDAPKPAVVPVQPEPVKAPSDEEVEEVKQEIKTQEAKKPAKSDSMHSDMVNMAMDLFDGKIIE